MELEAVLDSLRLEVRAGVEQKAFENNSVVFDWNVTDLISHLKNDPAAIVCIDMSAKSVLDIAGSLVPVRLMKAEEDFSMLSYRWRSEIIKHDPVAGAVAIPDSSRWTLEGPVWVDCFNHFNDSDLLERVLNTMGRLYGSKPVYIDYLMSESVEADETATSLARGWMMQETMLCPQEVTWGPFKDSIRFSKLATAAVNKLMRNDHVEEGISGVASGALAAGLLGVADPTRSTLPIKIVGKVHKTGTDLSIQISTDKSTYGVRIAVRESVSWEISLSGDDLPWIQIMQGGEPRDLFMANSWLVKPLTDQTGTRLGPRVQTYRVGESDQSENARAWVFLREMLKNIVSYEFSAEQKRTIAVRHYIKCDTYSVPTDAWVASFGVLEPHLTPSRLRDELMTHVLRTSEESLKYQAEKTEKPGLHNLLGTNFSRMYYSKPDGLILELRGLGNTPPVTLPVADVAARSGLRLADGMDDLLSDDGKVWIHRTQNRVLGWEYVASFPTGVISMSIQSVLQIAQPYRANSQWLAITGSIDAVLKVCSTLRESIPASMRVDGDST